MDIAKYLESRGWKKYGDEDGYVGWYFGQYSITPDGTQYDICLDERVIFIGTLLTEEKADIIMESLGIA